MKIQPPPSPCVVGTRFEGASAMRLRLPAVAGHFYPSDPVQLRDQVVQFLDAASVAVSGRPKALIVPHAGYVYSGPVAASGYAWLVPWSDQIKRVVLLGTCHTPGVSGLAATSAEEFLTPLGRIPVDRASVEESLRFSQVHLDDDAQDSDHALEVQLPFLQIVLGSFAIVPFLVGRVDAETVDEILELLWDGDRTVIVVSSDLSHHYPYEEARRLDEAAARAIERLDGASLSPKSACGRNAIVGLLYSARQHGLNCQTVDLRSSGDTAGPRQRVVGYGSWVFLHSTREGNGM
jgi:MEMO1 family protein